MKSGHPHLQVHKQGTVTEVSFPAGRVDGAAVQHLLSEADDLIAGPQARLLVDLTGMDHIASGAVGCMIALQKRAQQVGARFHLAVPSALVREALEVMDLSKFLEVFPTLAQARAALNA